MVTSGTTFQKSLARAHWRKLFFQVWDFKHLLEELSKELEWDKTVGQKLFSLEHGGAIKKTSVLKNEDRVVLSRGEDSIQGTCLSFVGYYNSALFVILFHGRIPFVSVIVQYLLFCLVQRIEI